MEIGWRYRGGVGWCRVDLGGVWVASDLVPGPVNIRGLVCGPEVTQMKESQERGHTGRTP